jgi:zinc D-Ala-D-Ala dipeptidase
VFPFKSLLLSIVVAANGIAPHPVQDDLRAKPLPAELQLGPSALGYHSVPINLQGQANREPLVDLREYGVAGEEYYARTDGLNAPYYRAVCVSKKPGLRCRKTVAEKLKRVNERLKPYGVELFVFDAYRSIDCQRALWAHFLKVARSELRTDDAAKLREFAGRFCSDPSSFDPNNSNTWPTHTTGGAVDLTLRRVGKGDVLFTGTVFDEASPASYTNAFEQSDDDSASVQDARRNRRLLYWAMHAEGFTNYPYEWWHFDYGTQMWARNSRQLGKQQQSALYGYVP